MTSIEWFYDQLDSLLELYPSEWVELGKLFHKAKEMHEREIIIAHGDKYIYEDETGLVTDNVITGQQYYQETFKKD